jgi:hypothetical protein
MQPQERFVSPASNSFGHSRLGTVSGTFGGLFDRSVRKTEGKREKATVSLTVAFDDENGPARGRTGGAIRRRMIAVQLKRILN